MINEEKKQFGQLVQVTMGVYDKGITKETLDIWWNAMSAYSLDIVRDALSRHVQDKDRGRYAPKPADVIAVIDRLLPDGRPGCDEAWAIYPHFESQSAVISEEISYAAQIALPLIIEGDMVAARMAFKDAYNRIVEQNKTKGIKPKWFATLGHDPDSRERALADAVAKNRISDNYAQSLSAPKDCDCLPDLIGDFKLLSKTDKTLTEDQKARNSRRIAEIRKMLNRQKTV